MQPEDTPGLMKLIFAVGAIVLYSMVIIAPADGVLLICKTRKDMFNKTKERVHKVKSGVESVGKTTAKVAGVAGLVAVAALVFPSFAEGLSESDQNNAPVADTPGHLAAESGQGGSDGGRSVELGNGTYFYNSPTTGEHCGFIGDGQDAEQTGAAKSGRLPIAFEEQNFEQFVGNPAATDCQPTVWVKLGNIANK